MIKSYVTRTSTNLVTLTKDMANLMTKIVDNDCEVISTEINNFTKDSNRYWVGVIFYKTHKKDNFTLR